MSYHSADTDEAHRIWTKTIHGNVIVAEYDDGDYLLYKGTEDWDSIILEPHQMQSFIDFTTTIENSATAAIGENILTGEIIVDYEDGEYTLHPEDMRMTAVLSEKQVAAINDLVTEMQTVLKEFDEMMETQGKKQPQ